MNNKYLLMLYADVIDSTFCKMFFNRQWTQREYDILTECANRNTTNYELRDLQDKAKEMLDYESRFGYRHCQNITR